MSDSHNVNKLFLIVWQKPGKKNNVVHVKNNVVQEEQCRRRKMKKNKKNNVVHV